jgi:hypothetical protein
MRAPRAEQADEVPAADVDDVLGEEVLGEVPLDALAVAPEQRHVAGVAAARELAVEAHDVVVGVAGGGGEEAHARAG